MMESYSSYYYIFSTGFMILTHFKKLWQKKLPVYVHFVQKGYLISDSIINSVLFFALLCFNAYVHVYDFLQSKQKKVVDHNWNTVNNKQLPLTVRVAVVSTFPQMHV